MELRDTKKVELQYLDQWFSNLVDTINYDLGQIEGAVPALSMQLTTVDTAPIRYLVESLNKLVDDLNDNMERISDSILSLEARIDALQAPKGDDHGMA